jgi:pimeloyl-ACP methyl ester carboxylesterase
MEVAVVAEQTRSLEALQGAYLDRKVPGHRITRVTWSGGSTQVIEAGDGPPILFIHGGLGEAFQWAPLLPILARKYRVLAVDRPGHGLADPFDYRGVDLFAFGARFIREVLDVLELPALPIVGNSMGGLWSVACAITYPGRVSRLMLVGSPAGVQRSVPFMLRLGTLPLLRAAVKAGMSRPTREGVRNFWKLLVAHPECLEDDFLELSAASQRRNHVSWLSMVNRALDIRGMKPYMLLHNRWNGIRVPTTLVWGELDAWSPPETGDAIAAAHSGIQMIRVAGAGHAPWFDDAAGVARAIESALS